MTMLDPKDGFDRPETSDSQEQDIKNSNSDS